MDSSLRLSIQPSSFALLLGQKELIEEYAAECSIPEIGAVNPQPAIYAALEQAGVMQSLAAIEGERVVGFATVLTPILPHYGKRVATVESIFVAKAARTHGVGRALMAAVECSAKDAGCVAILYSAPAGGKFERVLNGSKRYRRTNAVFTGKL